jgi:hypothetical protein
MTTAFCIGNGVSRKGIDLSLLAKYGSVYGCNALYRDFTPTALIATDKPIACEIQESGYSARHRFYTRRPLSNLGAQQVPKKYFGYSSGPICVSVAALDLHHRIYLLGYDMGPALNGKFNNVYADTDHYKKSSADPTYTGNWIRQIRTVILDSPQIDFVRVQGPTTQTLPDLAGIANLSHLPMAAFLDRINNGKDL